MTNTIVRNRLTKKISSLSFDKEELKRLLDILQQRAKTASEIEYKNLESRNVDNLEAIKRDLEVCAVLKITIAGFQSEELFGTIEDVFNSVSFPEAVKTVYVNSELPYDAIYKYRPQNHFQLLIDFSKPRVFDLSFQPSQQTPNESQFEVQGSDSTWVNGVFHEMDAYISSKPARFSKVHRGSIYDFLVWAIGIPLGFYVGYKVLRLQIPFFEKHTFFESMFLTYCFFASLFILRMGFHYFRWLYPMIEYRNKKERSIAHQLVLGAIVIGVVTSLLYDFIKLLAA